MTNEDVWRPRKVEDEVYVPYHVGGVTTFIKYSRLERLFDEDEDGNVSQFKHDDDEVFD